MRQELEKSWIQKIIFANTQLNKFGALDEILIDSVTRKGLHQESGIDEKKTEWICD